MSITIGIYHLFAYTIPGLFYVFVVYEFLQRVGVIQFDLSNIPNISSGISLMILVLLAIAAYLSGHLFDYLAQWFVNRFPRPKRHPEVDLNKIKEQYPDLGIRFGRKDWELLFSLLRQRSLDHSRVIDSFQANSIMFRNISFALLLIGLLHIYTLITSYSLVNLILLICIMVLCGLAYQRSHRLSVWFFTHIFEASLAYGKSLEEVVVYRRATELQPSNETRKAISRRKQR